MVQSRRVSPSGHAHEDTAGLALFGTMGEAICVVSSRDAGSVVVFVRVSYV